MKKVTIPLYVLILLLVFVIADLGFTMYLLYGKKDEPKPVPEIVASPAVTPSAAPAAPSYQAPPGRWPETSLRKLTAEELDPERISRKEMSLMKNEIYARHGYIFQVSRELKQHFESQSWYRGTTTDQRQVYMEFSDVEKYNVELISNYEKVAERLGY